MLHKTRGIVLHTTKYSESSVIAKIYTELFGLQSYLLNSVRSKKAKIKPSVLQPLSLLDMVVYHKENRGLQRISEIRNNPLFTSIPYHPIKSTIAFFLNEILYKSIREEEPNLHLFEFIFNSLHWLDLKTEHYTNFHLLFLLQLSKYLGFYPHGEYSAETSYFNLPEGKFCEKEPLHVHFLSFPQSEQLDTILKSTYEDITTISISTTERKFLLEKIIDYYELHITGFQTIKSYKILEEVIR